MRGIISDDIVLDERLKEQTWYTSRGYNSEKVRPDIKRVKTMNRTDLISKYEKEIDNRITLVLTYHPALTKVYETLQKAQISMFNYNFTFTTSTCFP